MNIERHGENAVVEADGVVFSFEVSENPRDFEKSRKARAEDSLVWSNSANNHHIGDYRILPYGDNNDLPLLIKNTVQNNSKVPGIIKKKTGMLWGKGPKLYSETFDKNFNLVREWKKDEEIEEWMDSWNAEVYLAAACTDYNHIEGVFTKLYQSKGVRIGESPKIAKLEHIGPDKARLASLRSNREIKPTHIILNDWVINHLDHLTDFKVYDMFDFQDPFKSKNSIYYSNMYSFCTDYYTVPDIYGSLEWIRRSTAVPLILKALSKNSINVKYHITSPREFWNQKKKTIMENCTRLGQDYKDSMLNAYQKSFLKEIAVVLSGESNAGKFWHTVNDVVVEGNSLLEQGWSIKAIDQNIKDFAETQMKMGDHADRATAAAVGVHGSIGGTGKEGQSDSGSEQLYALQNYMMTGIDIPEMIVTKALNYAIKANFPEKKLKIGFYHDAPTREQDKSEKDRSKSQKPS